MIQTFGSPIHFPLTDKTEYCKKSLFILNTNLINVDIMYLTIDQALNDPIYIAFQKR